MSQRTRRSSRNSAKQTYAEDVEEEIPSPKPKKREKRRGAADDSDFELDDDDEFSDIPREFDSPEPKRKAPKTAAPPKPPKQQPKTAIAPKTKAASTAKKEKAPASSKKAASQQEEMPVEASSSVLKYQAIPVDKKAAAPVVDANALRTLAKKYPDGHWSSMRVDLRINDRSPLSITNEIKLKGQCMGLCLDPSGSLLACVSTTGVISILDIDNNFSLLSELCDLEEANIQEYWTGSFTPDGTHFVGAGCIKDRGFWSDEINDLSITRSPIKIFNVLTGAVVAKLDGHEREVYCVKGVFYKDQFCWVSTCGDGSIIRWTMAEDFVTLKESRVFTGTDPRLAAMHISFAPDCGNRYFVGACESSLSVFDMEHCAIVASFDSSFSICDYVKFLPADRSSSSDRTGWAFLARGQEAVDDEGEIPFSKVAVLRLYPPVSKDGEFTISPVSFFIEENMDTLEIPCKLGSNGRYVASPTNDGQVFIFNMSKENTAVLTAHRGHVVRDVMFHPTKPLLITCADDSRVIVYTQGASSSEGDQSPTMDQWNDEMPEDEEFDE